jgi:hypothetical protein
MEEILETSIPWPELRPIFPHVNFWEIRADWERETPQGPAIHLSE